MKLIHISDLHLGKRVYNYSMLEDQTRILEQIRDIVAAERPDAVLIAGDVYDRGIPPEAAMTELERFLEELVDIGTQVFISAGNHDSAERLSFGSRLMQKSGIYLTDAEPVCRLYKTLTDAHGEVDIYMMPYIRPTAVKSRFPGEEIKTFDDAVGAVLCGLPRIPGRRSVLVAHQFVAGGEAGDSEELYVGGSEQVSAGLFAGFSYVALGHLHRPQNVGGDVRIRYCGTPLKYSFSECNQQKSVTVAELDGQGTVSLRLVELRAERDMVQLRGSFAQLTDPARWQGTCLTTDFVHIILTDEDEVPEAAARLRSIYANMMHLSYDNTRTRGEVQVNADVTAGIKDPMQLFKKFFEQQNNTEMTAEQEAFVRELTEEIWREDK